jgi:hypothetical protein
MHTAQNAAAILPVIFLINFIERYSYIFRNSLKMAYLFEEKRNFMLNTTQRK